MLKIIAYDFGLFDYSMRTSSSAFQAGSTMHKNFKIPLPEFSINCSAFGGTYAESSFCNKNDSSLIVSFPEPSKI